ncbi:MAG TPA: hypothetical protein ENK98_01420 [Epsilonproteobacteria bacterium]|nr:hypothetical protein [Campylobacterota bacterium]
MKKIILYMTATVAVVALNGCGGLVYSDDYYSDYVGDDLTTLFLVDERGLSYADIPYKCDSMTRWSHTAPNGEFSFIQHEYCEFDFNGLDGNHDFTDDEIVRIVDDRNSGKGGIEYGCESFGVSSTFNDGSFDYDQDDVCTFYL